MTTGGRVGSEGKVAGDGLAVVFINGEAAGDTREGVEDRGVRIGVGKVGCGVEVEGTTRGGNEARGRCEFEGGFDMAKQFESLSFEY